MRVTVTDNLWTQMGLVNGTTGILIGIYYKETNLKEDLEGDSNVSPCMLLVQMDSMYTGPGLYDNDDGGRRGVIPITMEQRSFYVGQKPNTVTVQRQQFPLQPAFALTIHKSQGLTAGPGERVKHLVVDIGHHDFTAGLAYVALSRTQFLSCMALCPEYTFDARWKRIGNTRCSCQVRKWVNMLQMWAGRQATARAGRGGQ
jgi:ATP-dependent DNA helicase PIF1